jgi:hypothetical protein
MIYCPKCGAANTEDHKFCIQCGEALEPEKGQRCPMCGAINPPGNVFCDECQARLVPVFARPTGPLQMPPSLRGLSLPSKPVEELGETAPTPEPEVPEAALAPEVSGVSQEKVEEEEGGEEPAWLVRLRAEYGRAPAEAEEAVEESPAWLQELREAPAEETEPEVSDWLSELRRRAEEEVPVLERLEEEEEEIPTQVAELGAEEEREKETEVPPLAEAGEMPLAEAPVQEEVPDWLRSIREGVPSPAEEEEVPALGVLEKEKKEEEIPAQVAELSAEKEHEEEAEVPPLAEAGEMPPAEAPAQAEVPDWLRGIREGVPSEEEMPPLVAPTPAEVEEEAAEELPDWLREVVPQAEAEIAVEEEGEGAPPVAAPPAPEEAPVKAGEVGELPEWLQRIAPPEEAPPPEVALPAEAGVPEWLQAAAPGAEAPPLTEAEKEAPSWLQEISDAGEVAVFEETAPAMEAEERVPSWLQELAPISEEALPTASPEEVPAIAVEGLEEGAVPTWLEELGAMEPIPFEEPAALVEAPPEERVEEGIEEALPVPVEVEELAEVPALAPSEERVEEGIEEAFPFPVGVEELAEVPAPVPTEEGVEEAPPFPTGVEELVEAGIPAWVLALRPAEMEAEPTPSREEAIPEVVETTGLLAGIPGVLPAESIIGVPHTLRPPTPVTVPGELALEAKLLGEVFAQERPPAVSTPKERGKRLAQQAGRLLLYLALITAVLIPYFFSTGLFEESVSPALETEDFHRTIENLSPDSVVLVAFDYDPSLAAEMSLQAEALIHHLMKRGLKVMTISMYPGGQALAEETLRGAASVYNYQPVEDYINLGYLPNQAVSLWAFTGPNPMANYVYEGTPVSETPLGQRINRLTDFGLIVELAAGQDTLRWWVEQVGSQYPGLPMVAGVSAGLDPYVRPYYETPGRSQLKGLLVGLPGAAQYEGLTKRTGRALDSLESQGLAHLTIVALIVVGNVVHFASRLGKGK